MPFDIGRFERDEFKPRVRKIELTALKDYFGPDEKPEFTVRGLEASELQVAIDAQKRSTPVESLVLALAKVPTDVETIRQAIGLPSKETPGEIAKRIEMLTAGSVAPKLEQGVVVKLAATFPIEFYQLTNAIIELTGLGAEAVGKQAPALQPVATA